MAKIKTNQERLNELFDMDPRTDSGIADALGVSKQTISAWRKGTRSPKQSVITMIAKQYGTTEAWLMGWDLPGPDVSSAPILLTDEEKLLLKAYRSADPGTISAVKKLLDII